MLYFFLSDTKHWPAPKRIGFFSSDLLVISKQTDGLHLQVPLGWLPLKHPQISWQASVLAGWFLCSGTTVLLIEISEQMSGCFSPLIFWKNPPTPTALYCCSCSCWEHVSNGPVLIYGISIFWVYVPIAVSCISIFMSQKKMKENDFFKKLFLDFMLNLFY